MRGLWVVAMLLAVSAAARAQAEPPEEVLDLEAATALLDSPTGDALAGELVSVQQAAADTLAQATDGDLLPLDLGLDAPIDMLGLHGLLLGEAQTSAAPPADAHRLPGSAPAWLAAQAGPGTASFGSDEPEELTPLTPASEPEDVEAMGFDTATPVDLSPLTTHAALAGTALLAILARLYSRFERDEVLRSQARARIHEAVTAQPGATLGDLERATGFARGALVHHCQMMERHGVLCSKHDGLNRRFFPGGVRLPAAPRPPTAGEQRLLDALRDGPLSQAELAERLGVSVQAVSYHLLRLRRDARVEREGVGKQRRWALAPEDAEQIAER